MGKDTCVRVHIDRRTLSGTTINGAFNNINNGGVFDVEFTPKRTNQEKAFLFIKSTLIYYGPKTFINDYGAKKQQLASLESYGIIVYQRTFTIYVMHQNMDIYVVDILTEFSNPNSKDQLYVLREVIEKVYMFKFQPPEGLDLNGYIEVKVSLGGVWKQSLSELSGGQRSLIALSLILSLLQFKPALMY
ncbi:3998_t:CDS:2, partial [Funneliformis geosporum]